MTTENFRRQEELALKMHAREMSRVQKEFDDGKHLSTCSLIHDEVMCSADCPMSKALLAKLEGIDLGPFTAGGVIWKPERESLRNKREIVCEVPELLMQILEHDYSKPPWGGGPEEPIEIRYHWGRHQRGEAWAHLLKKVPYIHVVNKGEEETFMLVFSTEEHDKWNPYRKNHGANYWGWSVVKWELVPPPIQCNDGDCQNKALWVARGTAKTGTVVVLYACDGHRHKKGAEANAEAFGATWTRIEDSEES